MSQTVVAQKKRSKHGEVRFGTYIKNHKKYQYTGGVLRERSLKTKKVNITDKSVLTINGMIETIIEDFCSNVNDIMGLHDKKLLNDKTAIIILKSLTKDGPAGNNGLHRATKVMNEALGKKKVRVGKPKKTVQ